MSTSSTTVFFASEAGQVLSHSDGYAVLRYRPVRRQPGELALLLSKAGQLLQLFGWHRMLADNRELTPFTEEEKEWFQAEWIENRSGYRPAPLHVAIVQPQDVFARLSVLELVNSAAGHSVHYSTFAGEAAAVAHLRQL